MRILFSIALLLGLAFQAQAQITINSISRASSIGYNYDGSISSVFGGIVGPDSLCSTDSATLCNNCDTADLACNQTRIHSNLNLRVNFTVSTDITGVVSVGTETSGTYATITPESVTGGTLNNGDTGVVDIEWGDLCLAATGTTACDLIGGQTILVLGLAANASTEPDSASRVTVPVRVVIPNADTASPARNGYDLLSCTDLSPSTGICDMTVYPGDQKAFVLELQTVGAWPQSNTVKVSALRVFYSSESFAAANYNSSNYFDFELNPDGVPPSAPIIDGLENGVQYFFRPAIVDEANNVAFLVDEMEIDSNPACASNTDAGCGLIATPGGIIESALKSAGL